MTPHRIFGGVLFQVLDDRRFRKLERRTESKRNRSQHTKGECRREKRRVCATAPDEIDRHHPA